MRQEETVARCVNCAQSETERPLIQLRYSRRTAWVCSGCMPILIHQPQEMAQKLAALGKDAPAA